MVDSTGLSTSQNGVTLLAKIQQTLGSGLPGLVANGIALGNLAQIGANTFLGNNTGSTGNVLALTTAQVLAALGLPVRSYLAGLTLSNDGGSPNTVLDIAAGAATDSTNAVTIQLAAFSKSTGGAWVVGSGSNGMGNGLTIAITTWYHVFAIINSGAADVYFDTSVTAANKPASTTAFRRIGSFLTDGSAHIIAFIQDGDLFQWLTPPNDVASNNPGTSAVARTLTVPIGVSVLAKATWSVTNTGAAGNSSLYVSDLAVTDQAATNARSQIAAVQNSAGLASNTNGEFLTRTNTSAQVRSRLSYSDGSVSVNAFTLGWFDTRGRFS